MISGKIRLPRGHFNIMEDLDGFSEYSIISKEALEGDLPEAGGGGWEANAKESAPERPKPRTKPIKNLIDNFISINQARQKGSAPKTGGIEGLKL